MVTADRPFAREACGVAASYAATDSGEEFADRVADPVLDKAHRQAPMEASRARFAEVSISGDVVAPHYLEILGVLVERARVRGRRSCRGCVPATVKRFHPQGATSSVARSADRVRRISTILRCSVSFRLKRRKKSVPMA